MNNQLDMLVPFISQIKMLLRKSHVVLPRKAEVKLYHHYGVNNIDLTGSVFISVVLHEYCKFIVAMIPGQSYPFHFHRIKDESFFILFGDLTVTVDGESYTLSKGDILDVPRRCTHGFSTKGGCIFEELSTAYLQNDSVYADKKIQQIRSSEKFTIMPVAFLIDEENYYDENYDEN